MKMKMKIKTFDCVEMKRGAAQRIHEELKGLSLQEKVDYWRHRSQQLREAQEEPRNSGESRRPR
jgi:hypothetical protein